MTAGGAVRETMQPGQTCPEAPRRPLMLIHAADLPCTTTTLRAPPPSSSQVMSAATMPCMAGNAHAEAESTPGTQSLLEEHARDLSHSECSSSTFTTSTVLTQSQLPALMMVETAPHAVLTTTTTTTTAAISTTIQSSLQLAQPERSALFAEEESRDSASFTQSGSRLSRCRLKMRSLAAPAFDLRRVEQVQESCLFEEVCNAALCHPLSRITKHVYLGTWRDASNPELLRQHGITYVLNVAKELSEYPEDVAEMSTKTVTLDAIGASTFGPSRPEEPAARTMPAMTTTTTTTSTTTTMARIDAPSSSSSLPLRRWRLQQASSLSVSLPSTVRLDTATELSDAGARPGGSGAEMVYATIPMTDCHRQELFEHFEHAFEFIEQARREKGKVLVHCRRGISRSAAIVVAYLMASEQRSFESALHHVMKRRQCVSLNLAFRELLAEYQPDHRWLRSRKRRHSPSQTPQSVLPCSGVCPAESRHLLAGLQGEGASSDAFVTPKTTACRAALRLTTAFPSTPEEARELVKQNEECAAPETRRGTSAHSFRDTSAPADVHGRNDICHGCLSGGSSPSSSDTDSSCISSTDSEASNGSAHQDTRTALDGVDRPNGKVDWSSDQRGCGSRRARLEQQQPASVQELSRALPPLRQPPTTFFTVELATPAVNAGGEGKAQDVCREDEGKEEEEEEDVEEPGSPGRDLLLAHGACTTRPGFADLTSPTTTGTAKEMARQSGGLVVCTPPCAEGGAATAAVVRVTDLPRRRCSPRLRTTVSRGELATGSSPV